MSTNLSTTTNLPKDFVVLDGQTLELRDRRLHEIPTQSTLAFYGDRSERQHPTLTKMLSGLSATQVADVINLLPKDFHDDGQAALPGRARNLVTSAIEDGWLVTITIRYRDVDVEFSQPTATIQTLLRDLVGKVNASTARRPDNQKFTTSYLTQGIVSYGWDYDAEAMRMELVQDRRLSLSRVYDKHRENGADLDLPHRVVTIERHSDNDTSYGGEKLTWKEFTGRIHDHCHSHIDAAMFRDQQSAAARAAADAAFDGEAATPTRAALRLQLAGLQAAAEGRRDALAQAAMPGLRSFRPDRSDGAVDLMRRAAKYDAEAEVISTVKGILGNEGNWEGDRRLHLDEILTRTLTKLTQRLLEITSHDRLVASGDLQQDVLSTSYVIQTLSPLVRVTIGTEVLV